MGPTKAMSVMAWRATSAYIGKLAVATAASRPARRPPSRLVSRYTAQTPRAPSRQNGVRSAHSAAVPSAIWPGGASAWPMPATCMPRLISQ